MQKNPKSFFSQMLIRWAAVVVLLIFLAFLVPSPAMMESMDAVPTDQMNFRFSAEETKGILFSETRVKLTAESLRLTAAVSEGQMR